MTPTSRARSTRFPLAVLLLIASSALVPSEALALGDWVGVEPNIWRHSFRGTAAIDDGGGNGTTFDFQDTLGIEEDDSARVGRVWFRLGKSRLFLDYADTSRDGSAVLTADLDFHGVTYSAAETVTTDFDLTLLQATYRYTFDFKLVEFGVGLGLNVAQVDMELVGSSTGTEHLDEKVPYPTLSAAIAVKPFPGFRIRAEANGVSVDVSGNDVDILDARAQIEYYFAHVVGMYVGYRTYRFNIDSEDFGVVDATAKGPYVGFGLKF
jgi:hypothetical protein